jgi:gliding motility-associated-like protein
VATNGNCSYTDSVTVTVTNVSAAFTGNPPSGTMPLPVTFTNNSTNGVSYVWNFGDGSPIDNSTNPSHTYANPGTYTVMLVTTSANGCVDTAYFTIVVDMPFSLTVPNVFTPNGDGQNDTFYPAFAGVKSIVCDIYNRWGQVIYSWNTLTGSWNGTVKNGGLAPDGTYYYVMNITAADGTVHLEKGFLTLLRSK